MGYGANDTNGIAEVLVFSGGGPASARGHLAWELWQDSIRNGCLRQINNASGYAAGSRSLAFDGSGGTSWITRQQLCLWGTDTLPNTLGDQSYTAGYGPEILLSESTSTPLLTATASQFAHADNEYITPGSSVKLSLTPGAIYQVVFDFQAAAAGGPTLVWADARIATFT
jgi:hypothetical protein